MIKSNLNLLKCDWKSMLECRLCTLVALIIIIMKVFKKLIRFLIKINLKQKSTFFMKLINFELKKLLTYKLKFYFLF